MYCLYPKIWPQANIAADQFGLHLLFNFKKWH